MDRRLRLCHAKVWSVVIIIIYGMQDGGVERLVPLVIHESNTRVCTVVVVLCCGATLSGEINLNI